MEAPMPINIRSQSPNFLSKPPLVLSAAGGILTRSADLRKELHESLFQKSAISCPQNDLLRATEVRIRCSTNLLFLPSEALINHPFDFLCDSLQSIPWTLLDYCRCL